MLCGEGGLIEPGMVVEGEEIVIDIAAGEGGEGYRCFRWSYGFGLSSGRQPRDGLEANGLHVPTTLESVGFAIILGIVANMGVAAEKLYWDVPLLSSDRFEDTGIFRRAERDVTNDEEQVNVPVANGFLKPLLLDRLFHLLYYSVIRITREVVEKAKCYDADALVLGCKLLVPLRQWLLLARSRVEDIEIRSEIVAQIVRHRYVILILRRMILVKLVITRTYDVDVLLCKDV